MMDGRVRPLTPELALSARHWKNLKPFNFAAGALADAWRGRGGQSLAAIYLQLEMGGPGCQFFALAVVTGGTQTVASQVPVCKWHTTHSQLDNDNNKETATRVCQMYRVISSGHQVEH